MRGLRALASSLVTVLVLVLCGCSSLPSSGPVHEVGDPEEKRPEITAGGAYYNPAPPRRDASASEVVSGFLEAMKAIPVRTNVARQFLADEAKSQWKPEQAVITYEAITAPEGTEAVRVRMTQAGTYDATGAWTGWRSQAQETLQFSLAQEGGQWRITELPDALVVPSTWFAEQYQRVSRYVFEPTARMLTPEPVFVPRGDQMSTQLVNGLIAPVSRDLSDVVLTEVPPGLRSGLSVPISSAGVADVELVGQVPTLSEADQERLAAQFIWTLRQDPRVRAVDLNLRGRPVTGETLALNGGAAFDPLGSAPDASVFGLRNGGLVRGRPNELVMADMLGPDQVRASALAVDPGGVWFATADADATLVTVSRVGSEGAVEASIPGTGFIRPAWDAVGRLWMVDRTRARLRVRASDGTLTEVRAPGLTGARVRQMLVSRDGTRVVTLVERAGEQVVQVSRVRQSREGAVLGLSPARDLWFGAAPSADITAIAWQGPTGVAAVGQLSQDLAQVQVAGVDGAPVEVSAPSLVRGRAIGLLGTPADTARVLVMTEQGLIDSATQAVTARPDQAERLLTFTG